MAGTSQFAEALQRRAPRRTYPIPPAGGRDPEPIPVVIVGAGPIGLSMAGELANHGVPSVLLDRDNTSNHRSRAVCWSKRSLEILDRLGVATGMLAKGVTWNIGKVYCGDAPEPLYAFDLLPLKDQQFPAFTNLQQYYTQEFLVDALSQQQVTEIRWGHAVTGIVARTEFVEVQIETPTGDYQIQCDYLIAADGAYSPIRGMLGLDFEGRTFEDNFLIVDFRMPGTLPAERRFFFNAPFNQGRTALIHRQPDDIWRLDFQLGWNIDREAALNETEVTKKVRAVIGPEVEFEYEWISIYTFQCRRMQRFVHDRVIFAGDSAHLVSPFGARGANGGIQDVDNLAWKLARVVAGHAPRTLLQSYDIERIHAADENLRNSSRATDFMAPKTLIETAFRNAVLELATEFPFARALVNSGRLSVPCSLEHSPLITPDQAEFMTPGLWPGTVALDAPIRSRNGKQWLLHELGREFVCLHFTDLRMPTNADALSPDIILKTIGSDDDDIIDSQGLVAARYDGQPGTTVLFRPDQHVAARWRTFDPSAINVALRRSLGY